MVVLVTVRLGLSEVIVGGGGRVRLGGLDEKMYICWLLILNYEIKVICRLLIIRPPIIRVVLRFKITFFKANDA